MDSRGIMEDHKAIFRAIALGPHTEADSREMDQALEVEVDLTKVLMLVDQGSPVRLSHVRCHKMLLLQGTRPHIAIL